MICRVAYLHMCRVRCVPLHVCMLGYLYKMRTHVLAYLSSHNHNISVFIYLYLYVFLNLLKTHTPPPYHHMGPCASSPHAVAGFDSRWAEAVAGGHWMNLDE